MSKDISYYLSKGFEPKMAEYFANGRRTVTDVEANDNFSLLITFDNNERRVYDMKSLLERGTVFEPFMELENFRRVYLDSDNCISWDIDPTVDSSVVWSNKVDICTDTCYIDSVPYEGGVDNA